MLAAKQRDTAPELELRSALHRLGLRFRVDLSPIPGVRSRADVVFTRAKVAVFVDGCFWHGCPIHGTHPKQNADWWRRKLDANQARDRRVERALVAAGWTVLRVWEHEEPTAAAQRLAHAIERARGVARAGV